MAGSDYTAPHIWVAGTVAELTQELGFGDGSDSQFPILARYTRLNDILTHS